MIGLEETCDGEVSSRTLPELGGCASVAALQRLLFVFIEGSEGGFPPDVAEEGLEDVNVEVPQVVVAI